MRQYRQLTQQDRSMIADLWESGKTLVQIGEAIGYHASTISRELRRNAEPNGEYWCVRAHDQACQRRRRGPIKLDEHLTWLIAALLRSDWSPEQISGHLRRERRIHVSHVSIYAMIWRERKQGGRLWQHLRTSYKKRRRRYGQKADFRPINDRVSISARPRKVNERQEIGHWEVDLIEGAHHSGYLAVAVERVTRFVRIGHLRSKRPDGVERRLIQMLKGYDVKTLTFDNGTEFSCHRRVGRALNAKTYFCRPYKSWEKGAVENMNGLIRQYFPKKTCLVRIPWQSVRAAELKLNDRPRKILSFAAPKSFENRLLMAA